MILKNRCVCVQEVKDRSGKMKKKKKTTCIERKLKWSCFLLMKEIILSTHTHTHYSNFTLRNHTVIKNVRSPTNSSTIVHTWMWALIWFSYLIHARVTQVWIYLVYKNVKIFISELILLASIQFFSSIKTKAQNKMANRYFFIPSTHFWFLINLTKTN